MVKKIKKAISIWKTRGVIPFIKISIRAIQYFIFRYRREYLFLLSLKEHVPKIESTAPITIKEVTKKNLNELKNKNCDMKFFKELINDGSLLVTALNNGKIMGYVCISFNPTDRWGSKLNLNSDEVWEHDAFIEFECRGGDLFSTLITYIAAVLRKRGYVSILSTVQPKNIPSIKAHTKCGFEKIGEVRQLRILGLEKFWISGR